MDNASETNQSEQEIRDMMVDYITNALGNPNFNLEPIFDALKDSKDGSVIALLNVLPEITESAKKLY